MIFNRCKLDKDMIRYNNNHRIATEKQYSSTLTLIVNYPSLTLYVNVISTITSCMNSHPLYLEMTQSLSKRDGLLKMLKV